MGSSSLVSQVQPGGMAEWKGESTCSRHAPFDVRQVQRLGRLLQHLEPFLEKAAEERGRGRRRRLSSMRDQEEDDLAHELPSR